MAITNDVSKKDAAEETAIAVLGWLAVEPDLMARFLSLSGLTSDGLRTASTEPGFFAGLLGFLMSHEPTLLRFCESTGYKPEAVASAYRILAAAEAYDPS